MLGDKAVNGKKNGLFKLEYLEDGVYLTVFPPVENIRRADPNEVLNTIARKRITNFNKTAVEEAVKKADGTPVLIAEPQEEAKVDAAAKVVISQDKMLAQIILTPPEGGGRSLTAGELMDALKSEGVVFGIKESAINALASSPVYNEMVTAAEGLRPENGKSGSIEYLFDMKSEKKPVIREDGRVDYRELNLIENVVKGQKLCNIIPPTRGVPGKTVTGADVAPVDGKPAVIPKGKNVVVSEDGLALFAAVDGQVMFSNGKVNVFSTYEVPADVDNSTGNIYFVGNVLVRGNVLSGFTIEAGGNVEVWGVVEGAVIKAEGDIILRRGIQGLGKGVLISGGSITARYIEHSTVEARDDIRAEAIMHSNVKCGNVLELSGRKGLLVGGSCKVGKEIIAKVIGSEMSTTSEIEVGVDPTLRERHKAIRDEIIASENSLIKAKQAVTLLERLKASGLLTQEKEEIYEKSRRTMEHYTVRLEELKAEMESIEGKLQQDTLGKIRVYDCIYPGTKVVIGNCTIYVKEKLHYCTLYREGADIKVGPLDRR